MIYADANLLVYSAIEIGRGEECAEYLRKNVSSLATSFLSIDEVAWGILRKASLEKAAEFCEELLSSPMTFLEVDAETSRKALEIMRAYRLKPRDAFHAASMKVNEITEIVSEDKDFDNIPGIKRIWF